MGARGIDGVTFFVGEREMALEFGSCGSGDGEHLSGRCGDASRGGGECEGREEGGDIDVMSTDGDRARGTEEFEDGEGESSGAGGGGSTK